MSFFKLLDFYSVKQLIHFLCLEDKYRMDKMGAGATIIIVDIMYINIPKFSPSIYHNFFQPFIQVV